MKTFKIYVNATFDEEEVLVEVSNKNKVVVKGDAYHDKIDTYINGFLAGLQYSNVEYKVEETEYITPDNKMFKKIGFYNDGD